MKHPLKIPDIGIHINGEVLFFQQTDILYIHADGSYCRVVLASGRRFTLARKLGEIERMLPDFFLRIHHSHLVNLCHVVKFVKQENGFVVMTDGKSWP